MDLFHLANASHKVQYFYRSGTWDKPNGITMVYILSIGAGGGGGGGFSGSNATTRGGGGGGGSGGCTRVLVPAMFIQDTLIVTVGAGGKGGSAGVAGTAGSNTTVDFPRGDASRTPLITAFGGGGGGAGAGSGTSAAGAAGAISTVLGSTFANLGTFTFISGQVGSSGGIATTTQNGVVVTYGNGSILVSGGGGGASTTAAGTSANGGNITGIGYLPTITGGSGDASLATNGGNGIFSLSPFYSMGGAGGGSSYNGTGGNGGNAGVVGSGGGGGGAGVTAGSGGDGGGGLVIIYCW